MIGNTIVNMVVNMIGNTSERSRNETKINQSMVVGGTGEGIAK